jgi:hypothetical protein
VASLLINSQIIALKSKNSCSRDRKLQVGSRPIREGQPPPWHRRWLNKIGVFRLIFYLAGAKINPAKPKLKVSEISDTFTFFTFQESEAAIMRFGTKASITQVLTDAFGVTFLQATTDQKLVLIECSAFLMRRGGSLREAISLITPEVAMPPGVRFCSLPLDSYREGLTLIALLYGGVNRDCGAFED